jgi:hypothetical protein
MRIALSDSSVASPLNALIWVFGVAGGILFVLMIATMILAGVHKRRRVGNRYEIKSDLSNWDSIRILTTGDLVMDAGLRQSAKKAAEQLRASA